MGGINPSTTTRTVKEIPGDAVAIQDMPTGWTGGGMTRRKALGGGVVHFVRDSV